MMHVEVPVESLRKLIKKLPENSDLSVLHLPGDVMKTADVLETAALLNAVDDVLDALPNLSVLGIHGLQLRPAHIPVLTSMFGVLRCKLTGLSLSLQDWDFDDFQGERLLLEAIFKMRKLEMLAFPEFKTFFKLSIRHPNFLASAQHCTVFVRGEPIPQFHAAISAVAPNLTTLAALFEA
jgi:hypothetical protein